MLPLESPGLMGMSRAVQFLPAVVLYLECARCPGGSLVNPCFWQGMFSSLSLFSHLCATPCQSTGVESSPHCAGGSYNSWH